MTIPYISDYCDKCGRHASDCGFCARLDTGGHSGAYMCKRCWQDEMRWRRERNDVVACPFEILPFPAGPSE